MCSLLYCTNLTAGMWYGVPFRTNVMGTGGQGALSDVEELPACFYRVQAQLPE
jgi:hypothetical protein